MKIIRDERLKLQNLKNVRIAFVIQTLGILGILGYDLFTSGVDAMRANPLWILLLITMITFLYLTMSISVDQEQGNKSPKKGLTISIIVLIGVAILIGFLVAISEGQTISGGLLMGSIVLVCGFVPIIYIYHLRNKRLEE